MMHRPVMSVVMHDVAPSTWKDCSRLLDAMHEVAPFSSTLLVVPAYEGHYVGSASPLTGRQFADLINERRVAGDELALHGYCHRDFHPIRGPMDFLRRRIYTAGEDEFARLSEEEAFRRLSLGLSWFAEHGWQPEGFIAPAWLMSEGTWRALCRLPFRYTTTLNALHLLPERRAVSAPSIVYSARSALRRTISKHVLNHFANEYDDVPNVRFGLHPIDAQHPKVLKHWQSLLERYAATHDILTKAQIARRLVTRPQDVVQSTTHSGMMATAD